MDKLKELAKGGVTICATSGGGYMVNRNVLVAPLGTWGATIEIAIDLAYEDMVR